MALVAACTGGIDEVTAPVTSPTPTAAPAPTATTVPTPTAEPTLIPTVTPTSLPETLQREPAVPLADCAGSVHWQEVQCDRVEITVQNCSRFTMHQCAIARTTVTDDTTTPFEVESGSLEAALAGPQRSDRNRARAHARRR